MTGTIQERNRRLYVVVQNGGEFEYYPTIYVANAFRQAYGNHDGERVYDTGVGGVRIFKSMDNQRRYPLISDTPEWVEGVKLEIAGRPEPQVFEVEAQVQEPVEFIDYPTKEEAQPPKEKPKQTKPKRNKAKRVS